MERMGKIVRRADRSESEKVRTIHDRVQIVIRLHSFRNRCPAVGGLFSGTLNLLMARRGYPPGGSRYLATIRN